MPDRDPVLDALESWHGEGLIDDALHAQLRERAEVDAGERRRRQASRFVTGTGAFLLVAAFVVLTTIFWEDLTPPLRAVFLWAVTFVVLGLGVARLLANATDRLGTALVAAAMPLSVGAMALVREWRPAPTYDAAVLLAATLSALLIGFFASFWARRNPVLPAAGLAFTFLYVPVFSSLLGEGEPDALLVTLSVVALVVLMAVTLLLLFPATKDLRVAPGLFDGLYWVAFAATFALVPGLWFEVIDPFDGYDSWGPILTFAALAAWSVLLGIRSGHNGILILGSLMVIVDAWYFGIAKGEAIGTFLALFASALVLFWLGHRLGLVGRVRRAGAASSSEVKGRRG